MIFGVGTDICDVRRIRRSLDQLGERFAGKILQASELAVWQERSQHNAERGVRFLASRFAAKEALSKAIGLGMQMPMTWQNCAVSNTSMGAPSIAVDGVLKAWCDARQLVFHLSLSDEADYVVAFCVAEVRTPPLL